MPYYSYLSVILPFYNLTVVKWLVHTIRRHWTHVQRICLFRQRFGLWQLQMKDWEQQVSPFCWSQKREHFNSICMGQGKNEDIFFWDWNVCFLKITKQKGLEDKGYTKFYDNELWKWRIRYTCSTLRYFSWMCLLCLKCRFIVTITCR